MTNATGIDVSRYQATTPSLVGLSFLFARSTYGTSPDTMYAEHIANAKKAGLVTGAYHFGINSDVSAQVKAFLDAAGSVDLYVLDLESDGGRPSMTLTQAREFITRMHSAGKQVGLYHSQSGFTELGQDWNWVARWGLTPPSGEWTFWQYRGSPLDLDRYNGTEAQLRAWVHPQAPVTHRAHIRPLAVVRSYRLGSRPGIDCITRWIDTRWGLRPSSAPCEAPVFRETCDGKSHATTVRVTKGHYAGQHIRVGHGVTVREA